MAAAILLALGVAGCGAHRRQSDQPAPKARMVITGSISADRISVSPHRFGAGPIRLVVANLTGASQQVTLETADRTRPGIRQQTAPINPRDTAELRADLHTGRYTLHVTGDDIAAATLRVTASRHTTRNDLLQP